MKANPRTLFISAMVALVGLVLMPSNGFATALIIADGGILNISDSTGVMVGITTSPELCIEWSATPGVCNLVHSMAVSGVSTDFAVGTGTISDILNGASETIPFETVTGGGLEAGNTIDFNLDSLVANGGSTVGNCSSDAAFNSCTPTNSPFTFSMDPTGTQLTVSFAALLSGYTGTSASGSTPYEAIFSTQFSGTFVGSAACNGLAANITNALTCEAEGGTIASTWSATESPMHLTQTPEPAETTFAAAGLIALALLSRRLRTSRV